MGTAIGAGRRGAAAGKAGAASIGAGEAEASGGGGQANAGAGARKAGAGARRAKADARTGMDGRAGAAFFDFDNTLIHGDAGPAFGAWLYRVRRHEIKEGDRRAWNQAKLWAKYAPFVTWMGMQAGLYKVGARRRSGLVRSAYKGLKGIPSDLFYAEMDAFVDEEIPPRIYPRMVVEIERHQQEGRRCVVVTTGSEHLVARALRHFPDGVEVIGCRLEERRGRLTGKVDGPLYGADKQNIIRAYCRAGGLPLSACWAYSDHYSDYHMLETVGRAVCVNPRGRLERLAKARGWTVLRLPDPRTE